MVASLIINDSKLKTFVKTSFIRKLLFAGDAAVIATSIDKAQELVNSFCYVSKLSVLPSILRKTEVIQAQPTKQIKGVKQ